MSKDIKLRKHNRRILVPKDQFKTEEEAIDHLLSQGLDVYKTL